MSLPSKFCRIAALPTAFLAFSCLAGCSSKDQPADRTATQQSEPRPTPPGPGGPGGTMMNKPSTNPNGAPGDAIITAKVKSALIADPKVGATKINVDTKSDVVVLRGTVKSARAKAAAEADAKKMEGVSKVINQLTVTP